MGVYVIGEIIRNTRLAMNMSQEKLAEGICMPNYLSRIECGKQVPQKKIYDRLMARLESNINQIMTSLQVDEFELLEKEWKIARAIGTFNYQEAQELLWELEVEIDREYLENEQYVKFTQAILDHQRKRVSIKEYRERLLQSIKLTIPEYDENWKIRRVLSRNEIVMLIDLYGIYGEEGQYEKAIGLSRKLLKYYEELYPRGNRKYYVLTLSHISKWYGLAGNHKEAIDTAKKGISECKRLNQESAVSQFLYDIAWNLRELLEKEDTKKEEIKKACRHYILQAYGISLAYERIHDSLFYEKKIKLWFKE